MANWCSGPLDLFSRENGVFCPPVTGAPPCPHVKLVNVEYLGDLVDVELGFLALGSKDFQLLLQPFFVHARNHLPDAILFQIFALFKDVDCRVDDLDSRYHLLQVVFCRGLALHYAVHLVRRNLDLRVSCIRLGSGIKIAVILVLRPPDSRDHLVLLDFLANSLLAEVLDVQIFERPCPAKPKNSHRLPPLIPVLTAIQPRLQSYSFINLVGSGNKDGIERTCRTATTVLLALVQVCRFGCIGQLGAPSSALGYGYRALDFREETTMTSRALPLILVSTLAVLLIAACGTDDAADTAHASGGDESPLITRTDQLFTPESFTQAGWKKSKQYDTATVPGSTEIWYGFFNQKNVEIRFYKDHQDALGFGVSAAVGSIEGAVKRSKGGRLLDFSGGSFSAYADYVVTGNTVLLCELDRTPCELLVERLE